MKRNQRAITTRAFWALGAVSSLLAGLSGCGLWTIDLPADTHAEVTSELSTGSIRPSFSAQFYGEEIVVYASLFSTGGDRLRLGEGDGLWATDGEARVKLTDDSTDGVARYSGKLPRHLAGVVVRVEFVRSSGVSALDSRIPVPTDFTLGSLPTLVTPTSTLTLDVEGFAEGAASAVWLDGTCYEPFGPRSTTSVVRAGQVTIPLSAYQSEIQTVLESNRQSSCELRVRVRATTKGTYDSAWYMGGTAGTGSYLAEGLVERSVVTQFLSTTPATAEVDSK